MARSDTTAHLAAPERAEVRALVDAVTAATGRRPLSDDHWIGLTAGDPPPAVLRRAGDGALVGVALLGRGHGSWSIEVVAPDPAAEIRQPLVADAYALVDELDPDASTVYWWAHDATADDRALADALGLRVGRELLQMRIPLPAARHAEVATRAFVPGEDDEAFVAVNNRAFAAHPEQGGWTVEKLRSRMTEDWFDPAGFRLHERDGRLAAFCWTKLHHD